MEASGDSSSGHQGEIHGEGGEGNREATGWRKPTLWSCRFDIGITVTPVHGFFF